MFLPNRPGCALGDVSAKKTVKSRPAVILATIPNGDAGTRETLKIMSEYARASVRNPAQIVRRQAIALLGSLPPRQWVLEMKTLHAFVRDQIRYMKDPHNLELVQTPEVTLELGVGDCDDKATLLAALLSASGHPAQFVAVSFDSGPFSHVLVETQIGNRWIPLETIIPKDAGWFPPGVKRQYRRSV